MPKPTIHIYLGEERRKQVQHAAVEMGITTSDLVRRAIDLYLEGLDNLFKPKNEYDKFYVTQETIIE